MSNSKDTASVSAIVINFNGGRKLRDAVTAICAQSTCIQSILIVDNGSTDDSLDDVEDIDPRIEVLALGQNFGLTRARNIGLQTVKSEFVLLCDNDVNPATNALTYLLRAAEKSGATVVCPRIIYEPVKDVIQTDAAENHFLGLLSMRRPESPVSDAVTEVVSVNCAIGSCYFLKRDQVLECGGFNELYFFYFEDLEFSLRIRGRGLQILFDSNAVVYHNRGHGTPGLSYRGFGEYPRLRAELSMRNRLLTVFLHFERRSLVILSPALIIYESALFLYCLFRGWVADWLRSWRWIFDNRREIRVRRTEYLEFRRMGDKKLLSGGPIPFSKGFLQSTWQKVLASMLSATLDAYWRIVRNALRD